VCDKIKQPSECSEEEKKRFYLMVLKGEQVDKYKLRNRIEEAKLLSLHYKENRLVGIAALKQPYKTYIKKVFSKAGVSEEFNKYNLEIGWAYTESKYRHKGISSNIIRELISRLKHQNIFAITRTNNSKMQSILERNGFRKTGKSFQGRNDYIQLFTLSYDNEEKKNKRKKLRLERFLEKSKGNLK